MLMNKLHGTVADRPIDSQVVQTYLKADESAPLLTRMAAALDNNGNVEQVQVVRRAPYNKG
jgi:hypothetical protein